MQRIEGKSLARGVAAGKLMVYRAPEFTTDEGIYEDSEEQIRRFEKARLEVLGHRLSLAESAGSAADSEGAAIFASHAALMDDRGLTNRVREFITETKKSAEYGVMKGFDEVSARIRSLPDPYIRQRSVDIQELKNELLMRLSGRDDLMIDSDEPVVLGAWSLTAAQAVRLDRDRILAIVLKAGSPNDHAAILVKSLGIPCVIRAHDMSGMYDGRDVIVDGTEGLVFIDPDDDVRRHYDEVLVHENEIKVHLKGLKGSDAVTKDGRSIGLFANISGPWDLTAVTENDAAGIGLFRSDYLFLRSMDWPDEEMQYDAYSQVLEGMKGRRVVIRTVDIGSDKKVPYLKLPDEENPALGLRAIRISLNRKEMFKTQLRALLRASVYGNLGILFPMIISAGELHECRELLEECHAELEAEGKKVGKYEIGVMIETPASVFEAEKLAKDADFLSIGTNDLTQFTLALDRENSALDRFFDPHHPAVMREISMTVEAAHACGSRVCICGELAADPELTEEFIRLGVDELSVTPSSILPLRACIREMDLRGASRSE